MDAPDDPVSSSHAAVALVSRGGAMALMKGSQHTDELLSAVVSRDGDLRTNRRISHCFWFDLPTYHKPLMITDAVVNIAPGLKEKIDILANAIGLAHRLGIERPKIAVLSSAEMVNLNIRRRRRRPSDQDGRSRSDRGGAGGRPSRFRQRDIEHIGKDQGHSVTSRRRPRHPGRSEPRRRQRSLQILCLCRTRRMCGPGPWCQSSRHIDKSHRQPPRSLCVMCTRQTDGARHAVQLRSLARRRSRRRPRR